MKGLFKSIVISVVMFSGGWAAACSMAPIDMDAQINVLRPAVPPALDVSGDMIGSVVVLDADARYIWNDPMCPEGISSNATFRVSYQPTQGTECSADVRVVRQAATGLSQIPVQNLLEATVLSTPICTAN